MCFLHSRRLRNRVHLPYACYRGFSLPLQLGLQPDILVRAFGTCFVIFLSKSRGLLMVFLIFVGSTLIIVDLCSASLLNKAGVLSLP